MNTETTLRRKPRTLALELVDSLGDRIRDGRLAVGDKLPTEAAIMAEFDVSRTVVREAISKLQASGLVKPATALARLCWAWDKTPVSRSPPSNSAPCAT